MRILESESGIPRINLMENAGRSVYQVIKQRFELKDKKILIVCYHGNNGGDGFVAARHLADDSEVDILFIGDETKLKKEAMINFKKIEHNEKIQFLVDDEVDFNDYDINNANAYKVSVDIPTGLDPDTGEIIDKCVNAKINI